MIVEEAAVSCGNKGFSIPEYLEMENAATEKHEYYKGEIFAMSGGKVQHNLVSKNILTSLDVLLDVNHASRTIVKRASILSKIVYLLILMYPLSAGSHLHSTMMISIY